MTDLFVWRMSIKNHKGHCPKCGSLLIGSDGQPTDNVGVDADKLKDDTKWLFCIGCRQKGRSYVVGTVKQVDDGVGAEFADAQRMYEDADWHTIQKMVSKKANRVNAEQRTTEQLEQTIKQKDFMISMLQGSIANIKQMHEKEIAEKDKTIKELNKEIKSLEADLKRMEKGLGTEE